jgi:hypothetical protein
MVWEGWRGCGVVDLRIFLEHLGYSGRELDVNGIDGGSMDLNKDLIVLGDLRRGERCDVIFRGFAVSCESNCSHGGGDVGRHRSWATDHSKHYPSVLVLARFRLGGGDITGTQLAYFVP